MKTLIEHFYQLRQKYTGNPPVQKEESKDAWQQHVEILKTQGIAEPGSVLNDKKNSGATLSDEAKLYAVEPSFVDLLPWVEFLPQSQTMLLDDGQSVAAFYELLPVGTEGREASWLKKVRDALENALQDSFDEEETNPWVIQLYAQDETGTPRMKPVGTITSLPSKTISVTGPRGQHSQKLICASLNNICMPSPNREDCLTIIPSPSSPGGGKAAG